MGQIPADYIPPRFSGINREELERLERVGSLECIYIDPSVEDNLKGQGFRFDLSIERGGGGEGRETERERERERAGGRKKWRRERKKVTSRGG